MTRPVATIKSRPATPTTRTWAVRCFLHPEPIFIGVFGAAASWLFRNHQTRKSALATLALHQRSAHPCIDCPGLACQRCKGTGVDLTNPATAQEAP